MALNYPRYKLPLLKHCFKLAYCLNTPYTLLPPCLFHVAPLPESPFLSCLHVKIYVSFLAQLKCLSCKEASIFAPAQINPFFLWTH